MHTEMWEHAATQANVATLRQRGAVVIEPAEGRLTGKPTPARAGCPSPPRSSSSRSRCSAAARPSRPLDLAGRHVVVSAGGTREYLDPVRFLGNRSSGLQGYALARAAAARGAEVTLVAPTSPCPTRRASRWSGSRPPAQLRDAVVGAAAAADAVVMAAAPADFRPDARQRRARSRRPTTARAPVIELTQNPDILAEISHDRPRAGSVIVGFAAETGDDTGSVLDLARAKLARKGCDLLVVNDVSGGAVFGSPDNEAVILAPTARRVEVPRGVEGGPRPCHLGPGGLRRFDT